MQANDLIRELLEVLEGREWNKSPPVGYCEDCSMTFDEHAPNCRYVAAVKAAREYLATPAPIITSKEAP